MNFAMHGQNMEVIVEEFSGKSRRTGLYKINDLIHFEFYCLFDKDAHEEISAKGQIAKEDYVKGLADLAKANYCKIPLVNCKGYLEMSKVNDKIIVNFEGNGNIHGVCTGWDIGQLFYEINRGKQNGTGKTQAWRTCPEGDKK
jgi:hypothetical protein